MKRYRVCVADDSVEAVTVLCGGLDLLNYEAVAAHSGTEALEVCSRGDIDLVLLDVCMPDIDGYEVCRRLKQDPKTRDIPVVFVTVRGSVADMSKGFELGAVDYITKPYNLPMVMVRVEAALRNRRQEEKARIQEESFQDSAYTDHLTGLRNRRYLLERLQEEVEKAHRYNYPVSCIVFDVDDVQSLDEDLGPVSLDDLLVEVAMILRNHTRTYDVLARYDNNLLAAVLPHAPLEQAMSYVTKIMREVDSTTFSDPNFPTQTKLSAGIVACQNGSALGADFVLGEAMRGLLQAKSMSEQRLVARNLASEA